MILHYLFRKWLYVQDSCPLCHTALYKQSTEQHEGVDAAANGDVGAANDLLDPADEEELIDNDEEVEHDSMSTTSSEDEDGLATSDDEDDDDQVRLIKAIEDLA